MAKRKAKVPVNRAGMVSSNEEKEKKKDIKVEILNSKMKDSIKFGTIICVNYVREEIVDGPNKGSVTEVEQHTTIGSMVFDDSKILIRNVHERTSYKPDKIIAKVKNEWRKAR